MDDTVGVTIPLDPDAAKALDSPARREAAGRYLSRLLKSGRVRDVLAEAIAEAKSRGARQRPVETGRSTPNWRPGGPSGAVDHRPRRLDGRLSRPQGEQRPGAGSASRGG